MRTTEAKKIAKIQITLLKKIIPIRIPKEFYIHQAP